ncbi:MAG TPA: hypothetical protein VKE91_07560 [Blastocatellia bacterium]|nr:hypothetical protein [Blastocatellia bacterium]
MQARETGDRAYINTTIGYRPRCVLARLIALLPGVRASRSATGFTLTPAFAG